KNFHQQDSVTTDSIMAITDRSDLLGSQLWPVAHSGVQNDEVVPKPFVFCEAKLHMSDAEAGVVLFCASETVALDQLWQVVACKSCGLSTPSDVAMVSIEQRLEVGGFEGIQNLLF